jgi:hypothetical protein
MLDLAALRTDLRDADAAARRADLASLRRQDRANLGWLAAGAGIIAGAAALLTGLLAGGQAVLGALG